MARRNGVEQQLSADEARLLKSVPAVDTVGNSKLRTEFAEEGWDEDKYWDIRNRLVERGLLELGRGRGGSVRRVPVQAEDTETDSAERSLYEPLLKAIESGWAKEKNLGPQTAAHITAHKGRLDTGGKWTRPDIIVATYKTFTLTPEKRFDLISFEVKPGDALDVTGVYEALAHRRAATFSYTLVHVTEAKQKDEKVLKKLNAAIAEASRFDVGLIVAADPNDHDTWDEKVEAVRDDPGSEALEAFLKLQTSSDFQNRIKSWF